MVKVVGASPDDTQLTQLGMVSGTPKFMSPEQVSAGTRPDARTDIYSLGAVAYVMLTGRVPFDGRSAMEIMVAHARDPVPQPREFTEAVPEDLQKVILKCLEKRPDDRYTNASELREALLSCRLPDQWTQQDAESWWNEAKHTQGKEIAGDSSPN